MSLSPCSVPGHKPSFTLAEDKMELGLGNLKVCNFIPYLLDFKQVFMGKQGVKE